MREIFKSFASEENKEKENKSCERDGLARPRALLGGNKTRRIFGKEKDEKEDLALFVRIVFAAGVLSRRSSQREEYHDDDDGEKQQPWF